MPATPRGFSLPSAFSTPVMQVRLNTSSLPEATGSTIACLSAPWRGSQLVLWDRTTSYKQRQTVATPFPHSYRSGNATEKEDSLKKSTPYLKSQHSLFGLLYVLITVIIYLQPEQQIRTCRWRILHYLVLFASCLFLNMKHFHNNLCKWNKTLRNTYQTLKYLPQNTH